MNKFRADMTSYLKYESYDVFDENDKLVGYIKYSNGTLVCNPVIDGNVKRNTIVYWWQGGGIYDKNIPLDIRDELIDKCLCGLKDFYDKKKW